MKKILIFVLLLISFSSIGQSLSPYFTRTRTLQLEGYSSVGVNIPYSYSAGSVNSWTISDTLADQWVNQRINALLGGANFWKTDGDFNVPTGQKTATFQGGTSQSYYEFALENTLFAIQSGTVGLQFYTDNAWGSGGPTLWAKANTRVQLTAGTGGVINELRLNGTSNAIFESTDSLPMRYNANYTSKMTNARDIPDIGKVSQMIGDSVSGLTGDYWPLSGNFSIPTQIITLTGNTSFQRGGTNQFRLTSVLNDFRTPDGLNILSFTNALTTYTAGNGIPLRYGSGYSIGNDLDIIHKGYADSNVRGLSIPVTVGQAGNSIRIDGSGTQWEYYTPGSGVSEAYVAQSIDSVDNANEIGYTPAVTGDWPNADPTTVQGGLDSLAERITYIEGILPGIIDTVNLNSWNMDASSTLNVTLPVTNANLIAVLDVVIFHDNGTVSARKWNRVSASGVVDIGAADLQTLSSTTFQLVRGTDGYFDANGTSYDDTGVNRGYMVIFYRE